MHRGRRTIRLAKWVGVGLCVVVAATWAVSMWWAFGVDAVPAIRATIEHGEVVLWWSDRRWDRIEWVLSDPNPGRILLRSTRVLIVVESSRELKYSVALIPLWLPLALLALPTALLFWLDRRKPRPGFCGTCGYDLTGNVSGACPECGMRVR